MKILKNLKKTALILCLSLALIATWAVSAHHAYAATVKSQDDECFNSLSFVNIAQISCKISGIGTLTFTDTDPTDPTTNYALTSKNVFCNSDPQIQSVGVSGGEGGKLTLSDAGKKIGAEVKFGYVTPNKSGCSSYDPSPFVRPVSNSDNISTLLHGSANAASSLPGVTKDDLSGLQYSRYNDGNADPSSSVALFSDDVSFDGGQCSGSLLAVYLNKAGGTSGSTATEYRITAKGGAGFGSYPNLKELPSDTGCGIDQTNFGLGSNNGPTVGIYPKITGIVASQSGKSCSQGETKPGFACDCPYEGTTQVCSWVPSGSTSNCTGADCTSDQSNSSSGACAFKTNSENLDVGLEWIICPVITGVSTSADQINNFVSGQLNFDVNGNLTTSIKRAWAIFKDLVSVIIVIFMLVMVLSQAISWGPFDAYTIKKVLPKLVISIILIQVSWYICIYLIGLANDAGQGIGQLMAAPFGGMGNLDLPSLLHRLNPVAAASLGLATGAGGIIAAIFFGGTLLAWGWPLLVFAAIAILITVVVALCTLLVRNALIVILVMTSPFAFLAWMLPGTKKYWDMWKNNFTKLLLFFPVVMGMIYGGRIFAWVAGNLGASGPLDLVMVLVGFFGPYFYLPKTFKWGGNFLDTASKGIEGMPLFKKGREVAKNELVTGEESAFRRHQGHYASEYTEQDPLWAGIKKGSRLKNSILGGRYMPTEHAMNQLVKRGNAFKSHENEGISAVRSRAREKEASRTGNVFAGKEMDVEAVEEYAAKAAEAQAKGDGYHQKQYERVAKEAMKDLIATGSTLELNNVKIKDTDGKEKFIWQTKLWADLLNGSTELYPQVKAQAPDWVPHRTPVGLPTFRGEYDAEEKRAEVATKLAGGEINQQEANDQMAEIARRERKAEFLRTANGHSDLIDDVQWADSLNTTVEELNAGDLARVHPTYFERIGDMAKKGHSLMEQANATNDDSLRQVAQHMLKPAQEFGEMISRLSKEAGGRQQLSAVMGGSDTMEHLDYALQYSGLSQANLEQPADWPADKLWKKGAGSMEQVVRAGEVSQAQLQASATQPAAIAAQQATATANATQPATQTTVTQQVNQQAAAQPTVAAAGSGGASLGENVIVRLHDEDIGRLGNHIANAISDSLRPVVNPQGPRRSGQPGSDDDSDETPPTQPSSSTPGA